MSERRAQIRPALDEDLDDLVVEIEVDPLSLAVGSFDELGGGSSRVDEAVPADGGRRKPQSSKT